MAQCKQQIAGIVEDWNTWYQDRLFAPDYNGADWFTDSVRLINITFHGQPALVLLPDFVPIKPARIDPAAVTRPSDFKKAIGPTVQGVKAWCKEIMEFAIVLHRDLDACSKQHDMLLRLLKQAHKGPANQPGTGVGSHSIVCDNHLRWFDAFNDWGAALDYWENNLAAACRQPNPPDPPGVRQITRPPWPPWGA